MIFRGKSKFVSIVVLLLTRHTMAGSQIGASPNANLTDDQRRQVAAAHSSEEARALREKFAGQVEGSTNIDTSIAKYLNAADREEQDESRSQLRHYFYATESSSEKDKIREVFKTKPYVNLEATPAAGRAPASAPIAGN